MCVSLLDQLAVSLLCPVAFHFLIQFTPPTLVSICGRVNIDAGKTLSFFQPCLVSRDAHGKAAPLFTPIKSKSILAFATSLTQGHTTIGARAC